MMPPFTLPPAMVHQLPSLAFGIPLVLVAAIMFAATHHEQPEAIRAAAIQWVGWLCGILGGVLVAVWFVGWMT